ncbi:uncharacterized protein METZ01_LOCUS235121, partial [marine metagenome]
GGVHKPLRIIGGRTLLEWSVEPFDQSDHIDEIIVVLPAEFIESPPESLRRLQTPIRLVLGGHRRQDSVAAGQEVLAPASDIVVVHDAARPFCTTDLIARTVDAASETGAAIAALPALDTVKEGQTEHGVTVVRSTLEREQIFLAQTPQAFRAGVFRDAIARGREGAEATDEAALAELAGHRVQLVPGDPRNMKVTTVDDLSRASQMVGTLSQSNSPGVRVGIGYDLHRFADGRKLVLGGVEIPGSRGLLGHSDGDAICHAVADAVLGAANAGDIGQHFSDEDPRWKDASSIALLRKVAMIVANLGFAVNNVDVVVITEQPKIRSLVDEIQRRLADALMVTSQQVAIKGKTNEGIGEIGRGEAIVVHAIASLNTTP